MPDARAPLLATSDGLAARRAPSASAAAGLAVLRERQRGLPEQIAAALEAPLPAAAAAALRTARVVVTTGVGSSLAHARHLAWLLRTRARIPAWDVVTGAYLGEPGPEAADQTLVVFSQGLSPNARLPLAHVNRFRAVVLVTAAATDTPDRAAALAAAARAGAIVVPLPCAPEYEVLLRLVGPAIGYAVGLRLAAAGGAELEPWPDLAPALEAAARRAATVVTGDLAASTAPITLLATDGYAALAHNLAAKILEGMFLPWPNAVDALELAHGTLQEAAGKPRTFVALARGAPHEAALFARARRTLDPGHRWVELAALLPTPLSILEHEIMLNELVLQAIAARGLDQREWPAKGRDEPLYAVGAAADLATDG